MQRALNIPKICFVQFWLLFLGEVTYILNGYFKFLVSEAKIAGMGRKGKVGRIAAEEMCESCMFLLGAWKALGTSADDGNLVLR